MRTCKLSRFIFAAMLATAMVFFQSQGGAVDNETYDPPPVPEETPDEDPPGDVPTDEFPPSYPPGDKEDDEEEDGCDKTGDSVQEGGSFHWSLNCGRAAYAGERAFLGVFKWNQDPDLKGITLHRFEGTIRKMASRKPRAPVRLTIDVPSITSSVYSYSIVKASGSAAKLIRVNGSDTGPVRQILAGSNLTDISPVTGGFRVRLWSGVNPVKGVIYYNLPASTVTPLSDTVFTNPDSTPAGRLKVVTKEVLGAVVSTSTVLYTQTSSPDRLTVEEFKGDSTAAVDLVRRTILDYSARGSKAWDYTAVREIWEASSTNGIMGALVLVSRTQEIRQDFSTNVTAGGEPKGQRLVSLTHGYGSANPLTTTWSYYSMPSNLLTHGRIRSIQRPDGSWEFYTHDVTPSSTVATTVKYASWQDEPPLTAAPAVPASYSGFREVSVVNASTLEIKTYLAGQQTAWRKYVQTLPAATSSGLITVSEERYDGAAWHKKVSRHYPTDYNIPLLNDRLANRVVSIVHPNGAGETWAYGALGTSGIMEVSHRRGAVTIGPDSVSVHAGWKSRRLYNSQDKCQDMQNYSVSRPDDLLNGWMAGSVDPRGYPTEIYFLPSNARESRAYECCGLSSVTNREKVVTTYDRDALKRVWRVTRTYPNGGGSVVDTTAYNGLTVTTTRSSGGVSFLVSESTHHLNGDLSISKSPDANGDGTPEVTSYTRSLSAAGGIILTVTAPDAATSITENYRDGRRKSVTGTAVPDVTYSYGVSSTLAFGTLKATTMRTTRLTASGGTNEWSEVSYDPLNRPARTGFSGTAAIVQYAYYSPTATAGSRGKLQSATDQDGVVTTYAWDEQGRQSSVTTAHPGPGGSRTDSTSSDVLASVTVKGVTISPAVRIIRKVGGIVQTTSYRSGEGYDTAVSSFDAETLTRRTIPDVNGAWSVTTTSPDGTKKRVSFTKGGLEESRSLLSTADAVISTRSVVRNPLGRTTTETDSRTGPTAFGNFTQAGQARSVLYPGPRLIGFTFDNLGRQLTMDAPDTTLSTNAGGTVSGNITRISYWPTGRTKAQWGDQTTAVFYLYDEQGRMSQMRTYRNLTHNTEPVAATTGYDPTTWSYDPNRGFLTAKLDAASKGPVYMYTEAGRLRARKWARGAWTRYDYHAASGVLSARRYFIAGTSQATMLAAAIGNDSATPDVDYTFDSLGRMDAVTSFRGNSPRIEYTRNQYFYTANMTVDREEIRVSPNGAGTAPEVFRILDRQEDALHRSTGWSIAEGAGSHSNIYTYHSTEGRLRTVTGAGSTFTYDYVANSPGLPLTVAGPVHTVSNTWLPNDDAIDIKENKIGTTVISKYDYTMNTLDQRSAMAVSGTAFGIPVNAPVTTSWGYDARGAVVSADHAVVAAKDFGYLFDGAGNRTRSSRNVLNPAGATGSNLALYLSGTTAGSPEGGTALNQYGRLELYGKTAENNTYDDDGNQVLGRFPNATADAGSRVWDGENRLVQATPGAAGAATYLYDAFSRRVAVSKGGATVITLYDVWNAVADYSTAGSPAIQTGYTWGTDLSGTFQGAGGVGSLLAVQQYGAASGVYFPCMDGNGNITQYLNTSGNVVAHFEYGPFGEMSANGIYGVGFYSELFKYRFSSKPLDEFTGLSYFGYRFYDPVAGRWINRDPIAEEGGINLYGMLNNSALTSIDYQGLKKRNCNKFSTKLDIPMKSLADAFMKPLRAIPKIGVFGSAEVEGGGERSVERCEECCPDGTWKTKVETTFSFSVQVKGSLGIGGQVDAGLISSWVGGKAELAGGGSLSKTVSEGGCADEKPSNKKYCMDIGASLTGSVGGEVKVAFGSVTFARLTGDLTASFTGLKACYDCDNNGCSYAGTEGSLESEGKISVTGCLASQCATRSWYLWGDD